MTWKKELTPEETKEWDAFVLHQREHTLAAMADSAIVMSFVPVGDDFNIEYAVELGMAILLDKPLIVVVAPDSPVPEKLRRVADKLVQVDVDTEEGRQEIAAALKAMTPATS